MLKFFVRIFQCGLLVKVLNRTLKTTTLESKGRSAIAQTLPYDILLEIFNHAIKSPSPSSNLTPIAILDESDPSTDKGGGKLNHILSPNEPPLLLCHICKWWKAAALSAPDIWDRTYIPIALLQLVEQSRIEFRTTILDHRSTEIVEWWKDELALTPTGRSGASLFIYVRRRHQIPCQRLKDSEDSQNPSLEAFISTPFFRSAKRIEFDILDRNMLQSLINNSCNNTPTKSSSEPLEFKNLIELYIDTARVNLCKPGHTFPHSPKLRKLHIRYHGSDECLTPANPKFLPFSQLTHVSIYSSITYYSFTVLLKSCVNLQSAVLNLWRRQGEGQLIEQQNRTLVPTMRQLAIGCSQLDDLGPFSEFTFTNLTSLHIISLGREWKFHSPKHIESFLRATPNLKELHFDSCLAFTFSSFSPSDNPQWPPAYAERTLSALVPNMKLLVVNYIDPGDRFQKLRENIIRYLYSDWLCSGWGRHSTQKDRTLEFHIMSFASGCGDDIIHELERRLLQSHNHPVFDTVSVHRAKHEEKRFEVFDWGR